MINLILGLSISLIGGGVVSGLFLHFLRRWTKLNNKPSTDENPPIPSWLVGFIERIFFTGLVYYQFSGIPAAIMIWLTLKMVTNWNSPLRNSGFDINQIRGAMSALLAGLISLGFAVIGGIIAGGKF